MHQVELSKSAFLSLVETAARNERDDEALSLVDAARRGDRNALGFVQMWADDMPRAMAYAAATTPSEAW